MRLLYELHTHSRASDGGSTILENARAAYAQGLHLGISDHGPAHIYFGLRKSAMREQRQEIAYAMQGIPEIGPILQGVEANLIGPGQTDLEKLEFLPDYVILGYHKGIFPRSMLAPSMYARSFFSKNRLKTLMTDALIDALSDPRVWILAHPGEYIPIHMAPLADACARVGVVIEINERHPISREDAEIAREKGARFLLSSDAHRADKIGVLPRGRELMQEMGENGEHVVNSFSYTWDQNLRLDGLRDWAFAPIP